MIKTVININKFNSVSHGNLIKIKETNNINLLILFQINVFNRKFDHNQMDYLQLIKQEIVTITYKNNLRNNKMSPE